MTPRRSAAGDGAPQGDAGRNAGDDPTIGRLIAWGAARAAVRAILLTSTRAVPGAPVDALSDYDAILVVRAVRPFAAARGWIADFGEVLVAYWDPPDADPDTGTARARNVVQYADGLKIDFTLQTTAYLRRLAAAPSLPAELDAGYRTLLDKDGLVAGLRAPTGAGYRPTPPDLDTFLATVNDFYVGAPYVAKCLLRGDLLPAKWCLDYDMRHVYLLPVLGWWVGCRSGWTAGFGALGKGLRRQLPPPLWDAFLATYAGADAGANWAALFGMLALFGRVAREVAGELGYPFPEELDRRVVAHVRGMRGIEN